MKITHCIASIDEDTGGPARSVSHLVNALNKSSEVTEANILTLRSQNPLIRTIDGAKGNIEFFQSGFAGVSNELTARLKEIKTDIFHGQGIWQLTVHQMAVYARKRNIPYVISMRGMLEPWSLQQSKLKKKLAMFLFQDQDLRLASCLHATCEMETASIRNLGFTNPIANIPNGIKIENYPLKEYGRQEQKKILFLSRIHPKKGIENLIEAWNLIDNSIKENWSVEIVGNGEQSYINQLTALIANEKFEDKIKIVGPRFGEQKIQTYHDADLFVLPTYSENFGMVVAEALCCGVPVITTKGTPWEDIERGNAGKWIEIGVEYLKDALIEMMTITDAERQLMGRNGRKLIEDKYSIQAVTDKMIDLYGWILKKGTIPEFVNIL